MLLIVTSHNVQQYQNELDQAFRLRHNIFVEEKGWADLRRADGREMDRFDDEHAVHMLYMSDDRVVGYQRMLPTTRPHILSDILPELCEGKPPAGPHIWEWTRYCVVPAHRKQGRLLSPVSSALLTGMVVWGIENMVSTILIEMTPLWVLRLVQLHFKVVPLGIPRKIGGEETLAVAANFDDRTLSRLREMQGPMEPLPTSRIISSN